MSKRRIGVYICHCGGNISDYVDVEKVRRAVEEEGDVVVAKTTLFACSDSAQQEMMEDIREKGLDAIVIASCSPKLHLFTFRSMAQRAGLNPYQYVHVNLREQDSWTHTDDPEGATEKAIKLVRAGIRKARLSRPLQPLRVQTERAALIIGGGISGLRAALALADMGIHVFLIEKSESLGGWVARFKSLYPSNRDGQELINSLVERARGNERITIFTEASLVEKSGVVGDFKVKIKVKGEELTLKVGAIIVSTGFEEYSPSEGEFGYGLEGVVTLSAFKAMVENSRGSVKFNGKEVSSVAYIYCVGSRQNEGNTYCSRYCCNATLHTALMASELSPSLRQFHIYRDIRTYGKNELLYESASKKGSVFVKYSPEAPPSVVRENGRLVVKVRDLLTDGEELEIPVDLVVLVTGMVPPQERELLEVLKLPVGRDGFFNEIHPKLRPVETVIDGVFIAGAAQGPKNSYEAVASALAASAKVAGLVLKGYAELEPQVASVDEEKCEWCGKCLEACPYSAFERVEYRGKEVARVIEALCKGCGGCVPACPADAIDVKGYEDVAIREMIDGLLEEKK